MKISSLISICLASILTFSNLNTKELNWYFVQNGNTVSPPKESASFIDKYDTYYIGDPEKKIIYITFDEGYENGYTGKILDILKDNNVPAAFFVVKPYIVSNPDIIKRMDAEGHLVCNHSTHHPSMAKITDINKFNAEFDDVNTEYKNLTGKDMPKFFRPPMGKYSEQSLSNTKNKGYKTIFWSFAYKDWITNEQPTHEYAKKKIIGKAHNGEIMLLHAVSKTNTEILDEVLKELKSQGYEFKSLTELPSR